MKYILWSILALVLCGYIVVLLSSGQIASIPDTENNDFSDDIITKTLPNGMQVVAQKTSSNSVILMCFVKSGSIHEEEYLGSGISHYLEHLVSSGTTSYRTEAQYSELAKEIGAITNAYTTFETTAFHIQVEPEHFDTALRMLYEQMTSASLTQREVDREKEVILKEMILRSSPPGMQSYYKSMEIFESNTHYRYRTIGYPEQFSKITRNDLLKYYNRHFTPDNMVFVMVGAVEPDTAIDKVETTFAGFQRKPAPVIYQPSQPVPAFSRTVIEEFDSESFFVQMFRPLDINKPQDKFALDVAVDILYGKRTSPIAYLLTEEEQLVSYIYASTDFTPSTNHAYVQTMFETQEIEGIEKVLDLLQQKLFEYTQPNMITQSMIDTAVKRYVSAEYLGHSHSTEIEDIAGKIGQSIIGYGVPNSSKLAIDELKKVTVADVQRVISEYLLGNHTIFYSLPRGSSQFFANKVKDDATKTDISRHEISDKITLLYKYSSEKPTVRGIIYIPIGEKYESAENTGVIDFMVDIMLQGSKKYPSLVLSDWIEDRNITLYGMTGRDGLNIAFHAMNTDATELAEILAEAFSNPLFSEDDIEKRQYEIQASFNYMLSSPQERHEEFMFSQIFSNDKYKLTIREKLEILQKLTRPDLVNAYKKFFTADKVVVSIFGDISENDSKHLARTIATKIPNKPLLEVGVPPILIVADTTYTNEYNFEQVNIAFSMNAPFLCAKKDTPERKEYITMRVIEALLGDQQKGLHFAVRGENNLAYFVYTSYINSADYGTIRVETQTSLEKKNLLIRVVTNELKKLTTTIIPEKDIRETIENLEKMRKTYYDDESLMYQALSFETNGLGFDFWETLYAEMLQVTGEDIRNVAQKYLSKYDIVVSQPAENI